MRRLLLLVFATALVVRLAYAWEIRGLPTQHELVMDAQRYDELARQVLARGWRPHEAFYQAPLYPYLLAAVYAPTGGSLQAVRLAQCLLGALTAVLAALAAARLAPPPGAERAPVSDSAPSASVPDIGRRRLLLAGTAGLLGALYAPAVFYTPLLLKTVPLLFLESAALVALLPASGRAPSAARCLGAGCLLGAAALLQESLLALVPAAALYVLAAPAWRRADGAPEGRGFRGGPGWLKPALLEQCPKSALLEQRPKPALFERRGAAALALVAGGALALAPAALLNLAAGGELLLTSSQGGMNFYIGNAHGANGTYSPLGIGSQAPESQRRDAQALAAALAARQTGRPVDPAALTPGAVSAIFWREAARQVAADPAAWLRLLLRKTRLFWNAYEIPDAEGFRVYRRTAGVLRFDPVVFGLVAPLAALGAVALLALGGGRRRAGAVPGPLPAAGLAVLLALSTAAAVTLFFVFGRYRLAVVPFLLPLAAAGILELGAVAARHRPAWAGARLPGDPGDRRRGALALLTLAAAALAVNLPCWSRAEMDGQDAAIEYNLGTASIRWSEACWAAVHPGGSAGPGDACGQPTPAARLGAALALATRAAGYFDAAARASPGFFAADLEWATARARRGSYLAAAGQPRAALADLQAAHLRLAAALAAAPADLRQGDPTLVQAARALLASLDRSGAAILTNLGVQLIQAGQLDRAEEAIDRARALAPAEPSPEGTLALCWLARARAARRAGAEREARDLLRGSALAYRRAARLAAAAGRSDLEELYRHGLAAAQADLAAGGDR